MEVAQHRAASAASPVEALGRVAAAVAGGESLAQALGAAADALLGGLGATLVVVRVADREGWLCARGVAATSLALAAELEGGRIPPERDFGEETADLDALPRPLQEVAARAGADAVAIVPVAVAARPVGTVEAFRGGVRFDERELDLLRAGAAHAAAAVRALGDGGAGEADGGRLVELAGEALAAGSDERGAEGELVRLAADASGATGVVLWRPATEGVQRVAEHGERDPDPAGAEAEAAAVLAGGSGDGAGARLTLALGRPPAAALQLRFTHVVPGPGVRERLAAFANRAAHALRASERAREASLELERTRELLGLVARAELSLRQTLERAVDRVADLLGAERVAVYLREEGRLEPAVARGLAGPHVPVAERLLELALGPYRGRGILVVPDAAAEPALLAHRARIAETGIEAALAVPLAVAGDVTGLLAVYPGRGRIPSAHEQSLLSAIAAQLAVSAQNARLHEQAKALGAELQQVLLQERQSAKQLGALYEISRSFAQSLSLEATLEAVAHTVVELLGVDAAVIRMPDARRELLVPRALHVADESVDAPLRTILERPQPIERLPIWTAFRSGEPIRLDAELARGLGPPHQLLVPFLEKGSTAVILPIATPSDLLGTLKLLSLDPARPITQETVELGLSVAAQAALAIDNARLYQHQKQFADTMQRSLLPHSRPQLEGLELGDVYEPSSLVDVGGDVYDFIELDDGRLAVVLGDVTGHGIDAAADMAMAKFVFRSLAREHPEPDEFLAAANEVVCGEIATSKFITMLYLTVDAATGRLACASAGHPRPRLALPDGDVGPIEVRGLALGIEPDQTYDELRTTLPRGAVVVLYTDGVIEARRDGELYGADRLDAAIAQHRGRPARELAQILLEDCRAWGEGELADDCALVVLKRT